jgi:hypothetical protein
VTVTHAPAGRHEPAGPSFEGSVVIDIGGDVGALVVYTEPSWAGRELEIRALAGRVPVTHTSVRERRLPGGTVFAAVFPTLSAGTYRLPAGRVVVRPGAVTEVHVDAPPDKKEATDA